MVGKGFGRKTFHVNNCQWNSALGRFAAFLVVSVQTIFYIGRMANVLFIERFAIQNVNDEHKNPINTKSKCFPLAF